MYGWFLGWIAYDILVWHKSVIQVSLTNYVGAITAMALIWAGTVIFNAPTHGILERFSRKPRNLKEKTHKKRVRKPSKPTASISPPLEQLPQVKPEPQPEPVSLLKPPEEKTDTSPGCSRRIRNSLEIPDRCLTCRELLQCLSKIGK
jgi:outer membrane biosynthesis protein TonB